MSSGSEEPAGGEILDPARDGAPGPPGQQAWWRVEPETQALRTLQTAMAEAELAVARRMRLGQTDVAAMSHLSSANHPVGPGWLSQRLGVTPAAATELVDRLERAGHLERRRDTTDRRRVQLIPTGSALSEVGQQLLPLLRVLDQSAVGFTAEERAVIGRYLAGAAEAYAQFAADPPDPADPPGATPADLG